MTMTMTIHTHTIRRAPLRLAACLAALLAGASTAQAGTYIETFDQGLPAGWTTHNAGEKGEIQQTWAPDSYGSAAVLSANARSCHDTDGTVGCTISNWLFTPTWTFHNGDLIGLVTRTTPTSNFPDRLQVRFSATGATGGIVSPEDVGSFTTLLLDINPTLTEFGYPQDWKEYVVQITGLAGPTQGAIAFRHYVTDGGTQGLNSNVVYLDSFGFRGDGAPVPSVPEPATWLMLAIGTAALLGAAHRRRPLANAPTETAGASA